MCKVNKKVLLKNAINSKIIVTILKEGIFEFELSNTIYYKSMNNIFFENDT